MQKTTSLQTCNPVIPLPIQLLLLAIGRTCHQGLPMPAYSDPLLFTKRNGFERPVQASSPLE